MVHIFKMRIGNSESQEWITIFNKVVRVDFIEKVIFE